MVSLDKGATFEISQIDFSWSVQDLVRRGTSLLAATDFFPGNTQEGGIFIRSNIFENIDESLRYPEFVTEPGEYSESMQIEIESRETSASIYYTTDGSLPDASSTLYQGPILANETTLVNAISIDNKGARSRVNTGYYRIESPLGIEEEKNAALTEVFPNPCADKINLSFTEATGTQIKIFDTLGRITHEYVATGTQATINTQALSPGVYYIVATSTGKKTYRRFLKI
jgi:hypothetical protein